VGAGELGRIAVARAAFIGIHNPMEAELRGAQTESTPTLRGDLEGLGGPCWALVRVAPPPPTSALAAAAAPVAASHPENNGAGVAQPLAPPQGAAAGSEGAEGIVAAGKAIAQVLGGAAGALAAQLLDWLRRHVVHHVQRGVQRWQWSVLVHIWLLDQADIGGVFRSDPGRAQSLLDSSGLNKGAHPHANVLFCLRRVSYPIQVGTTRALDGWAQRVAAGQSSPAPPGGGGNGTGTGDGGGGGGPPLRC